jgi:hypothetical protein
MYDLYAEEYKGDAIKKDKIKKQLTTFEPEIKYCKNKGLFASGFRPDCIFEPNSKSS